MQNQKPKNGDFREDGKRFDGTTWREPGVNHCLNEKGLIYYKRKYRTLKGYLQQGGKLEKVLLNTNLTVEAIQSVTDALYSTQTKGYVYAIINPSWPDWVKIGKAVDADNRLNSYQTSSPLRDYELLYCKYFDDYHEVEKEAHSLAANLSTDSKGEWFCITQQQAKEVLDKLHEQRHGATQETNKVTQEDELQELPAQADLWSYAENRQAG